MKWFNSMFGREEKGDPNPRVTTTIPKQSKMRHHFRHSKTPHHRSRTNYRRCSYYIMICLSFFWGCRPAVLSFWANDHTDYWTKIEGKGEEKKSRFWLILTLAGLAGPKNDSIGWQKIRRRRRKGRFWAEILFFPVKKGGEGGEGEGEEGTCP